jgi:rhamnogalacturonyl hydrolase YesR
MIDYAMNEQIRLPGHGIYTRTTPVEHTTWVDDMFMGIPFLVHASRLVADESRRAALLDDAASQTLAFNSQVWDAAERLYMHARYSGNPTKLPYWSRCNGWASWAMTEILGELPPDHPLRPAILAHFREHCRSLSRFQDDCGLWPNVLNRPDSPLEVSGTAIFVMAMARGIRHGWLEESAFGDVVERGWHGLSSRIEGDGTVHDICMGTMCTEDVEYYVNRPFYDNDTHGLFAVLFAAIEVHQLQSRRGNGAAGAGGVKARIPVIA